MRVAEAAAALNIHSVGIYPSDDAAALHVKRCDHAARLPGQGVSAYLDIAAIVQTAVDHQCDAVHPGYGFLAENPTFAQACADAGLKFVGPNTEVLQLFGHKSKARQLAQQCAIPVVPALDAPVSLEQAHTFLRAQEGQPVVLKAVAGGGGRSMRIVSDAVDLEAAYQSCQAEAQRAFGEDTLQIERLLSNVRHIEVQILADQDGEVIHLGERDCSLQRRNQKLIELAPCPDLPGTIRQTVFDAAVKLARHTGYTNAGTFEFLVEAWSATESDPPAKIYFLEANPRIQVEHTVTEEAFGVDLVQAQLRIAAGENLADLGLSTDTPQPKCWSIQMRINLERLDAAGRIVPSTGTIEHYAWPSGPGIRLDSGGYAGYAVPVGYDSLLAKLVVSAHAGDAKNLFRKAARALSQLEVTGVDHNASFLQALLEHPQVTAGAIYTRFVDDHWDQLLKATPDDTTRESPSDTDDGATVVRSELQGTVVEVSVDAGGRVASGQTLLILDAMKMEYPVVCPCEGTVTHVHVGDGDLVTLNQVLFTLEPATDGGTHSSRAKHRSRCDSLRLKQIARTP